jgi:hypothetical protein
MSRNDESVVIGIDVVMPDGEAFPLVRTSEPNDTVLTYKIRYDDTRTAPLAETR